MHGVARDLGPEAPCVARLRGVGTDPGPLTATRWTHTARSRGGSGLDAGWRNSSDAADQRPCEGCPYALILTVEPTSDEEPVRPLTRGRTRWWTR